MRIEKEDVINFLAGFGSGPTSDAPVFPVDTIKTRMQARAGTASISLTSHLFRGFPLAMVGSALTFSTHWTIYEGSKRMLTPYAQKYHIWMPIVYACSVVNAQMIASCIRAPIETVKQQMQAGLFERTTDCIHSLAKQGGIKSFYNGYTSLLFKNIPYDVCEMTLYEVIRGKYMQKQGYTDLSQLKTREILSLGFCSSSITAWLTTPFDVVKTRMMLSAGKKYSVYTSVPRTMELIYKEEGIRALWSGAIARVIQVGINGALFFAAFEFYRQQLKRFFK
ncbi:hypothetical protein WA158_000364 [Blastocystis sp. Blastoise]